MLLYNPGDRMSAKASLLHPYFDDLDKTTLPAATAGKSFWKGNQLLQLNNQIKLSQHLACLSNVTYKLRHLTCYCLNAMYVLS